METHYDQRLDKIEAVLNTWLPENPDPAWLEKVFGDNVASSDSRSSVPQSPAPSPRCLRRLRSLVPDPHFYFFTSLLTFLFGMRCGWGDKTRTCGPMVPNHVRYQTALHPSVAKTASISIQYCVMTCQQKFIVICNFYMNFY